MPKKKAQEEKLPQGRPTKYKKEFNEQAYKLTLLGLTDAEMADFFGISVQTFNVWKKEKEGFSESLRDGKEKADADVSQSLFNRAMGMKVKESRTYVINGEIVEHVVDKELPPDPKCVELWLRNRQGKRWNSSNNVDVTSGGEKIKSMPMHEFVETKKEDEDE